MKRLCFATHNEHKLSEVVGMLGNSFQLTTLREAGFHADLEETQNTLEGNARQKARFVFETSGIPCFADDSGLEVDALGGAPGVHSARFAGPARDRDANNRLLLQRLHGISNRKAQFRTVLCLILPEGEWLFEGTIGGVILNAPVGTGGFGYDPLFKPDGYSLTLAEMTLEEKNKISHRANAFRKLVDFLSKGQTI